MIREKEKKIVSESRVGRFDPHISSLFRNHMSKGSLSNEAQHLSVLFIRQTNYTYFIMSANFFVRLPSGACIIYIPRSNTHTYIRGENVLLLAQLLICNLSNLPLIATRILRG